MSWEEMMKKSVVEFLNTISYLHDKNEWIASEQRKRMKIKGY